jgi:hypothetical protein
VCAAVLAGAGRGRARALTRTHIDAVEDASGRALPRVWIDGQRTLRKLAREHPSRSEGAVGRILVRAASSPRAWHARLRWVVMAALGLFAHSVCLAGVTSGWWPAPVGAWGTVISAISAVLLYAPVEYQFRRVGWWLEGDADGLWLRRTDRDGGDIAEPVALDPAACVVVISKPDSSHDDLDGGLSWLFLPPGPAHAAEAAGVNARATPWAAVMERARELRAARASCKPSVQTGVVE